MSVVGFRSSVLGFRLSVLSFRLSVSGKCFGFRVSGSGSGSGTSPPPWTAARVPTVPNSDFRVSSFRFQVIVLGFGFRFSCTAPGSQGARGADLRRRRAPLPAQ